MIYRARVTSSYGALTVSRVVTVDAEDANHAEHLAWDETGCVSQLRSAGFDVTVEDGTEYDVEILGECNHRGWRDFDTRDGFPPRYCADCGIKHPDD